MKHRQRFDGGRSTPKEMHKKYAFPKGALCKMCNGPPLVRAIVFYPLDEMRRIDPEFVLLEAVKPHEIRNMTVMMKHGPHIKVSTTYACEKCAPEFKKALARSPSWAVVDINDGPEEIRPTLGWGGTPT